MKVAICFYGLVGSISRKSGLGTSLDPNIAYDLNYRHLIKPNSADIFIHTWSQEAQDQLQSIYQPKSFLAETQLEFPQSVLYENNLDFRQRIKHFLSDRFNLFNKTSISKEIRKKQAFNACSRWYSTKKVIEQKKNYELKNNFKYDAVVLCRLDAAFYTPLVLNNYDLNLFYASNWNDYPVKTNSFQANKKNNYLGKGFLDFWFFSNSSAMDKFGQLYNRMNMYHISPHISSYQHARYCDFSINYTMYRWFDHDMIRRKEFSSIE